jgi:TolB-like protein/DNA-binding SARP family transcriptional activator/lipopolysaccharide biosynthesis regulator YciM
MAFVLQLFGGVRLVGADGKPASLPDRARALLAYLAVASSPVPRQILAELLSADGNERRQRAHLRQAVYQVRKVVAGSAVLSSESDLALNDTLVTADVNLFQRLIALGDDRSLTEAIELHRAPFLFAERSPSPAFEEWLSARRSEFLEQALDALLKLARSAAAADRHGSALAHARKALTLDPLREDFHRQAMRSLAAMGQRSNALRQYELARLTLAEELGVVPERETEALREEIARSEKRDFRGGTAVDPHARRPAAAGFQAAAEGSTATDRSASARPASWLRAAIVQWRAAAQPPLAAAVVSLLIGWAGIIWLALTGPAPSPPLSPGIQGERATMAAPRLSIVVLPLVNVSGDPDQEYFADGITNDLTTDLSRIDGSFVIARHTAFAYKCNDVKDVDVRKIGRELGTRYVLEGSVRRVGERVHINAELIDAATAEQVWAERFEGSRLDLPALHNEVTGRIAAALRVELVGAAGRRAERDRLPDPAAADDALRGWAILYSPYSREKWANARRLFEIAIAKDPDTVDALIGLSQVLLGYSNSAIEDRQQAEALLRRALDLEVNRAATHFVLGMLRRHQGRMPEAVEAYQTAIALDRNYARAYLFLGLTFAYMGRAEEAVALVNHAMRLNPRDPNLADHFFVLGKAEILLGRSDAAIVNLRRASAANPRLWYVHMDLAAAYGMQQLIDEAKDELAESLRLRPEFASLAAIKTAMPQYDYLSRLAQAQQTIFAGLRRAGLPDQ